MFLLSSTAFAYPKISSYMSSSFAQKSSSTQLQEVTIADDTTTPVITAKYGIRIQIPSTASVIFDVERTASEIYLYGEAVNNGKISSKPTVVFGDKDKTIVIPVTQDFSAGESVTIRNMAVEGFNTTTSESQYLLLIYDNSGTAVLDTNYFSIYTSSNSDTNPPAKPTDLKITQLSDTSVKLTWTDPTDLDLYLVDVLRGLNNEPVNGVPYKQISPGVQELTDTGLQIGDTIKYQLKAEDGPNLGSVTEEVSYIMVKFEEQTTEEEVATETAAEEELTQEEAATKENIAEEETTTSQEQQAEPTCADLTDILLTDTICPAIQLLKNKNAIEGYPNGEFAAGSEINRAEFLKIILTYFGKDISAYESAKLGFKDVEPNAWYTKFVKASKELGLITGYADGTFKPEQLITKAEAVKILFETAETEIDQNVEAAPFKDTPLDAQNAWYLPYAKHAIITGLDGGDANGNFDPFHSMTRGEIAELILRFSQLK